MWISARTPWPPVAIVCLFLTPAAQAVTIEWSAVGEPGNPCDAERWDCPGTVPYTYRISKHEVTNAQYSEFLNAKAASDPLGLFSTQMESSIGGIQRGGGPGSYTYSPIPGREAMPVNFVSFYDALRFANWMHNGQGDGDTETGAYTLLGGAPIPSNEPLTRNGGARVFIPTVDEWYKAAYYDSGAGSYFAYPAGTDTEIVCSTPGPTPNTANCGMVVGTCTDVGSYTGSASPSGTFDQGGNLIEWTDEVPILDNRVVRGGGLHSQPENLSRLRTEYDDPWFESSVYGFRVAGAVPGAGAVTNLRAGDSQGTWFEWDPVPGESWDTTYDLVRGDVSILSGDANGIDLGPLTCIREDSFVENSMPSPDAAEPAPGAAFFYLVRFQQHPVVGTWGLGSEEAERAGSEGCDP